MSEEAVIDPPGTFAATAIPLLKEYLAKILAVQSRVRKLKRAAMNQAFAKDTGRIVGAEYAALQSRFDRLRSATRAFAQGVSGMIDQGKVTPLERAELRLRLAELESALADTPALMQAYKPV